MADLLRQLDSPLLGTILAILGIVTGYIFSRIHIPQERPCWAIRSSNIIKDYSSSIPGLSIEFRGVKVKNLPISKILFWNSGADPIRSQDIPSSNPLRIEVTDEDLSILGVSIIADNNPASEFGHTLMEGKKYVQLEFNYLNKNNGAVIEVIHSGLSSSDIIVDGEIIGPGKPIKRIVTQERTKWTDIMTGIIAVVFMGLIIFVIGGSIVQAWEREQYMIAAMGLVGTTGLTIMMGYGVRHMIGRWLNTVDIPSGLEKYRQDPIGTK